ncbi:AraC family transcriptional regulator [Cohnella algarum]|uniref:AraC family transcriptional regulator n=1 Tax=Cohnella algarum TaxID=2044859 RepID=UPI00196705F1|nr:AraC family transcriptional regulator [Cohnella algarum]MBN2982313.1 helix-turn-helix transcriptional regulator [Cohnella algarum]
MLRMNIDYVPKINLVGYVEYTAPWIHFKRNINEYVLYVIKAGELHMAENGDQYKLGKGDMFLLEPNRDHWGTEKHTCDYYYIHFQHPDIQRTAIEDPAAFGRKLILEHRESEEDGNLCYFPKHYTMPDKNSFYQVMHALTDLVQLYLRPRFNRGLTGLRFSEMLIELSRIHFMDTLQNGDGRQTKSFMKVHALLGYIHQHYMNKLTSSAIEKELECNYDYINRVFKEVTGTTITRYINEVRIRRAKELIEATHLSFGEIAYLTGLGDPYYFSRLFKQYVGMAPREYYVKVREGTVGKV